MAARRSLFRLVAHLFASFVLHAHAASEAVGVWQGTLEREGAAVEVEFSFYARPGGYGGYFASAALRAVRIPLSKIELDAPRLRWELAGDRTTMVSEGTIDGDSLTGRFTEGAASGSFKLRRAASSRFVAREEEVTFSGADGAVLSGTILWPPGDGPFPGVVFLHGSGPEGRWGARYLASEFLRGGFAALTYDKRGVGTSKGDWRTAGFEELVADASAAVDALRGRRGITKVGIHGHSQGGTYSPWVAVTNPGVAFVIASAASGVDMASAEIYSIGNAMKIGMLAPEDRALADRFARALVASAYHGAPRDKLDAARREAEGRPWLIAVPPESSHYWKFSRRIAGYDPARYWAQVRVPVLLAYGARDERVPVRESISRITTVLRPHSNYTLKVFQEADHGFRLPPKAGRFAWPETVVGYPGSIVDWARLVTR